MVTTLNSISDNKGARQRRTIVGRGIGSGKGKTCGRGGKGQTARSGVAIKGFEGGQMPIYRRLPKRGFTNNRRVEYQQVNIGLVEDYISRGKIDAKQAVTPEALIASGIIKHARKPIKLLANGELTSKLTISVHAISKTAQAAVEKAGGSVTLLNFFVPANDAAKDAAPKKEGKAKKAAPAKKAKEASSKK